MSAQSHPWRGRLLALGVAVTLSVFGVLRFSPEGKRLAWTSHGLMFVTGFDTGRFLRDSALAVTLAAHEGAPPIWIVGYYDGPGVTMTMDEIRSALIDAIGERDGASYTVVAGQAFLPEVTPGVMISYEFWPDGGLRSDVTLHCAYPLSAGREAEAFQRNAMTNRGVMRSAKYLREQLQAQLNVAAEQHCPADRRSRAGTRSSAARETASRATASTELQALPTPSVATMVEAPAVASASVAAVPDEAPLRPELHRPDIAVRDSATNAALERAFGTSAEVDRIVTSPDTVYMRVGEVKLPERTHQLSALRADGSVALRITPHYAIENPRIVRLGRGGFEALAPGTTRVMVSVLSPASATAGRTAPSATFVLRVEP
ncbi:MAG: hypothetical protein ABI910_21695 [Gemmatimonadota bacterium]